MAATAGDAVRKMSPFSKGFSVYLDVLRVSAAFVVFGAHATSSPFLKDFPWLQDFAHDAVIVFFVLSGYIIAHTAATRDHDLTAYAVNRSARIYSVALPAVLLVPVLDQIAMAWRPDLYGRLYQYDALWLYIPFFLAFATDLWFFAEDAFSNVPYWSLCYEVWYYVLFAAIFFLRGPWRVISVGLTLLIMGPRLWLLFPLWAAGAWMALRVRRVPTPRVIFALALAGFIAVKATGLDTIIDDWVNSFLGGWPETHLRYSQHFLGDWLIGALILMNILAARSCGFAGLARRSVRRPIVAVASFSFTIYLFHMPLLKFFTAALDHDSASVASWAVLMAAVAVALIGLGLATEHQKQYFRRFFSWAASIVWRSLSRLPAVKTRVRDIPDVR
ncbi:acyltransferase family protein [Rhodospirillaceae bacterium SYSU D60014]|uniref:acyltransferase family protein n=1 Tax=Virgifigura deserti TaxID=2268457 RepID=UPI000E6750BC